MTGAKLRAIRKQMGMTQGQLADELELTETAIGYMERGDRPIMKVTEMAVAYLQIKAAPDLLEACKRAERILSAHHLMRNTAGAMCIRCGLDEAQFKKQPRCTCIAHTEEAELLRAAISGAHKD